MLLNHFYSKARWLLAGVLFFSVQSPILAQVAPELPARKMLEKIALKERIEYNKKLPAMARAPFSWEPTVLPRSIRSWMVKEFNEDTWRKIRRSDKL